MVFVLQWCPFSCGNRSQILLLWWHTVEFHPVDMGVYQKLDLFSNSLWICVIWGKCVSLIWSYVGQEVRKCSSVFTSFCGQWAHSLSSLESHVCLSLTPRLSLSLLLSWGSVGCVCVCEQSPRTSLLRGLFSRFLCRWCLCYGRFWNHFLLGGCRI